MIDVAEVSADGTVAYRSNIMVATTYRLSPACLTCPKSRLDVRAGGARMHPCLSFHKATGVKTTEFGVASVATTLRLASGLAALTVLPTALQRNNKARLIAGLCGYRYFSCATDLTGDSWLRRTASDRRSRSRLPSRSRQRESAARWADAPRI